MWKDLRGVGCRSKGWGGGWAGSELECDAGLLGLLCPCNSASPPARVLLVCPCVGGACGGGERTEGAEGRATESALPGRRDA